MSVNLTIAAIATPAGRGGVGIVRVSGPRCREVAKKILGTVPVPRFATRSNFVDDRGQAIDSGIALFFAGPHSFTGEDVLELHGHGGPIVMNLLLKRCIQVGATLARPGEFTERAYHNGKLDLAQAEAVADLIDSNSEQAARSAQRSLQGEFSRSVNHIVEELIRIRIHVEGGLDFPDEEIDCLATQKLLAQLDAVAAKVQSLLSAAGQGRMLNEGMTVVLAGAPNSGKSSLLNALAQTDRVIVSDTPGTTRDSVEMQILIDNLPVTLVDTAGLRETRDTIEEDGVRRTRAAMQTADYILYLIDDTSSIHEPDTDSLNFSCPWSLVFNKIDLSGRTPGRFQFDDNEAVATSAVSGDGLPALKDHMKQVMGFRSEEDSTFLARTRHIEALSRALEHLHKGRGQCADATELVAEELRLAQHSLSEITGAFTSDQLLGRIFASFCIGK